MRSSGAVQAAISCSFQVSLWRLLGRFPLDKVALRGCKSDTGSMSPGIWGRSALSPDCFKRESSSAISELRLRPPLWGKNDSYALKVFPYQTHNIASLDLLTIFDTSFFYSEPVANKRLVPQNSGWQRYTQALQLFLNHLAEQMARRKHTLNGHMPAFRWTRSSGAVTDTVRHRSNSSWDSS